MVRGENNSVVPLQVDADERKVLCIIKDTTNAQWTSCTRAVNIAYTTSGEEFIQEVARQYGYESGTFTVYYDSSEGTAYEVRADSTASIGEMCETWGTGSKRNKFTIGDKDGVQPTLQQTAPALTIETGEERGQGDGAVGETRPTSFRTDPPSYASAVVGFERFETGFVGLVNQAMTCYLNSLLQTLYMTPEFRNALYRWEFTGDDAKTGSNIPYQLKKIFLLLQTSKKKAVETTDLTKSFGWDSSEAWQQHDVQELCRVMFDALETLWKDTDQSDLINQLYQGKMKDYVKCLKCGNERAREDTYLDIPLTIKPFGSTKAYNSVEESLSAFVQPETLDGNNQYFCEECDEKCDAHKGLRFVTFPYLLTLQLKRFDFDFTIQNRVKLNDRLSFPLTLDLNPFVSGGTNSTSAAETDESSTAPERDDSGVEDEPNSMEDEVAGAQQLNRDVFVTEPCTGAAGESDIELDDERNFKNAEQLKSTGPYIYELFSIMIHSGSASGGHYYAYIKSFPDGNWYNFNDQHVSKINYADIKRTYGGTGTRSCYSAAYASSMNAYMLMYRRIDSQRNSDFITEQNFPPHVQEMLQKINNLEEQERQRRELERAMIKVKVFFRHPVSQERTDGRLEIHRDRTLGQATDQVYEMMVKDNCVKRECCRLIKYEEYQDLYDLSWDGDENTALGEVLGHSKQPFMLDLLLETRREDEEFRAYKQLGTTCKVNLVDLAGGEVLLPVYNVRAHTTDTVSQLLILIKQKLSLEASVAVRCVMEKHYNEMHLITDHDHTLREEGFSRSTKVFVCASSALEADRESEENCLFSLIDRHAHTIRLHVYLPTEQDVELFKQQPDFQACDEQTTGLSDSQPVHRAAQPPAALVNLSTPCQVKCDAPPSYESVMAEDSESHSTSSADTTSSQQTLVDDSSLGGADVDQPVPDAVMTSSAAGSTDGVTPADSGLPSPVTDSADISPQQVTSVEPSPAVSVAASPAASPLSAEVGSPCELLDTPCSVAQEEELEPEIDYYIKQLNLDAQQGKERVLTVAIDKRMSVGVLKQKLWSYLHLDPFNFKMHRLYQNDQEFEIVRTQENLQSYGDDSKIRVRLGRALRKGEYRLKVYLLQPTEREWNRYLFELIIHKGMTVGETKKIICQMLQSRSDFLDLTLDRLRLRKKMWRSPSTVYLDSSAFEIDIPIYASSTEAFVEVLSGPERCNTADALQLYVRRWRPSQFKIDPLEELILRQTTTDTLKQQLSTISGIPEDSIEIAKGRNSFPSEESVFDIHTSVTWYKNPESLTQWPLYITEDGYVIFYRDAREELKELNSNEKKLIKEKEAKTLHSSSTNITQPTYFSRKERALKIYTGNDETDGSAKSQSPV